MGISYRRFGTILVRNWYYRLRNIPKESRSNLICGGSLKSLKVKPIWEGQKAARTLNLSDRAKNFTFLQVLWGELVREEVGAGFTVAVAIFKHITPLCSYLTKVPKQAQSKHNNRFIAPISNKFQPNMVILRLATRNKRQISRQ